MTVALDGKVYLVMKILISNLADVRAVSDADFPGMFFENWR